MVISLLGIIAMGVLPMFKSYLIGFFMNGSGHALFPNVMSSHITNIISDPQRVLLSLGGLQMTKNKIRRRFHFEEVWFKEEGCEEIVNAQWNSIAPHSTTMRRFL